MRVRAPEPGAGRRGRWLLVLGLATLVSGLAALQATRLGVNARIEQMLPGTPAAQDYRRFLEDSGVVEQVFVLVTSQEGEVEPTALTEAAHRLAVELRPAAAVAHAQSGLDPADEDFFLQSRLPMSLLFATEDQLVAMRQLLEPEAVEERVRTIRSRLATPSGGWEKPLLVADPLGLSGELDWGSLGGQAGVVDLVSGAFLSSDGTTAMTLVTPRATELEPEAGRELQEALDAAYARVRAATEVTIGFDALGGPLYASQDEEILRSDLTTTITTSALGVSVLLLLYFGGFRTPSALVLSAAAGLIWTAAWISLLWGSLTVVGLAFASILIGLGVDYGIHGAVRFHDNANQGILPDLAIRRSISDTAPAILASALTTGSAFLVLTAATFQPLRELGVAVAIGLVMILAASLAVGAPLLATSPSRPRRGKAELSPLARGVKTAVGAFVRVPLGRERLTVGLTLALTALALGGLGRLDTEANLQSFRPADHPAKSAERLLTQKFGVGLDTLTVLLTAPDLDTALEQAAEVARSIRQDLGAEAEVSSPSDWLQSRRQARIAAQQWGDGALAEAVAVFRSAAAASGLAVQVFEESLQVLEELAQGSPAPRWPEDEWPSWLAQSVRVGAETTAVTIQVRAPSGALASGPASKIKSLVQAIEPTAAVASATLVGEELRQSILSELSRLGVWCGLAIALGVLISFRLQAARSLLALLPVALGLLWTLGLCGWLGIALNPFSAMMAPLVLGIGIDDGLHVLHGRARHGSMEASIRAVAPPMALTTLTTCVGFGSLLVSSIPALRSGGVMVAAGTLFCLLATLVVLPAVHRLARRSA